MVIPPGVGRESDRVWIKIICREMFHWKFSIGWKSGFLLTSYLYTLR